MQLQLEPTRARPGEPGRVHARLDHDGGVRPVCNTRPHFAWDASRRQVDAPVTCLTCLRMLDKDGKP